jgi:3-oxoacyl-[acyl-carrier protein] reductase
MSRGYSKKWIPRSENWTFWSTTPWYSASAPSRRSPKRAFTSTTTSKFLGAILTVQEAIKRFGSDGGSIINLSSIVGSHPMAGALLYASTKGAIETLTKGLALELAPRKIRVNAIAPGHTETEGNVTAGTFEGGAGAVLVERTPLGRLGRVRDIAPLAVFLASDESAWITGEVIRAAGGLVVAT